MCVYFYTGLCAYCTAPEENAFFTRATPMSVFFGLESAFYHSKL